MIKEKLYIFGGQFNGFEEEDVFYNDLFEVSLDNLTSKTSSPKAVVKQIEPEMHKHCKPPPRSSHSAVAY